MKEYISLILLLGAVLVSLVIFNLTRRTQQGFQNFVSDSVDKYLGETHTKYLNKGISNYNPISNLMNPGKNVLVPRDDTEEQLQQLRNWVMQNVSKHPELITRLPELERELIKRIKDYRERVKNDNEKKLKESVKSVKVTSTKTAFNLKNNKDTSILLNLDNNGVGGVGQFISKCEKVKTLNCDAFDDKDFSENCGMCHENGVDSNGKKIIGGLFIDDDTKWSNEAISKNMGLRYPEYTPAVGECSQGRFTTTKEQCIRMKNKMECEAKQNFKVEGCVLCSEKETFVYFDDLEEKKKESTAKIVVTGNVLCIIKSDELGLQDDYKSIVSPQSSTFSVLEGHEYIIQGYQEKQYYNPMRARRAYVAGYLEFETVNGKIQMDLDQFLVRGQKIKRGGATEINSERYTKFINNITVDEGWEYKYNSSGNEYGRSVYYGNQSSIYIKIYIPYTSIVPDVQDQSLGECTSAPLITMEKSAKFLQAGSCYKKGQGPGKYSMDCLQGLFIDSGCEEKGEAYPSTQNKANTLMGRSDLYDIADKIYNYSSMAYSGISENGKKLNIKEWDEVSRWCTGKRIVSPCSVEGDGPHSGECLAYLWLNKGATDGVENGEGPTYTTNVNNSSLKGMNTQFCTTNGYMSPIKPDGSFNEVRIKNWNELGRTDLQWVKSNMDKFHKLANDNTLSDEERRPWIAYCYGINFSDNRSGNDTSRCASIDQGPFNESVKKQVRNLVASGVVKNYDQCVSHRLVQSLASANKIPGDDNYLNTTRYKMCQGYYNKYPSWRGNNPGDDDRCDSAKNYDSTLDIKNGRTKSQLRRNPNYSWPSNYTKEAIFVYGPLDTSPLMNMDSYRNIIISRFPDWQTLSRGPMRWIWYTANAQKNAPVTTRGIYKIFNNTSDNYIEAVFTWVVDDTISYIGINGNSISILPNARSGRVTLSLPPGESMIQFNCENTGGPAGLIGQCTQGGTVLFQTDETWGWMNNKQDPKP